MDVVALVATTHRGALVTLCSALEGHYQGLAVAARAARKAGLVDARLARKLLALDQCFGVVRHITQQSAGRFLGELTASVSAARLQQSGAEQRRIWLRQRLDELKSKAAQEHAEFNVAEDTKTTETKDAEYETKEIASLDSLTSPAKVAPHDSHEHTAHDAHHGEFHEDGGHGDAHGHDKRFNEEGPEALHVDCDASDAQAQGDEEAADENATDESAQARTADEIEHIVIDLTGEPDISWQSTLMPSTIRRPWRVYEEDLEDKLAALAEQGAEAPPGLDGEEVKARQCTVNIEGALPAFLHLPDEEQRVYVEVALMELGAYVNWRRSQGKAAEEDGPKLHAAWEALDCESKGAFVPQAPRALLSTDGNGLWQPLLAHGRLTAGAAEGGSHTHAAYDAHHGESNEDGGHGDAHGHHEA